MELCQNHEPLPATLHPTTLEVLQRNSSASHDEDYGKANRFKPTSKKKPLLHGLGEK